MADLSEFSNNLASDLGPLLALFGESMTIQYLSECTSIADYIIFATAPIGIITALVSAIRICGGTYLRAFIGRATEGAAAAEVELCTSTGRDVCELFTRGGITRSLGGPSVLELVVLRETGDVRIYRRYLKRQGRWPRSGEENPRKNGWRRWLRWGTEDEPEPDVDLPNLSLNVGIVKPPGYVFWAVATIGVVLQTGVLVLAAVDAVGLLSAAQEAVDPLTRREEEEPTGPPEHRDSILFIAGTALMCFGMGSCAALIGRTTREFVDPGREPEKERLVWLQPGGQKIGDQTFDSYSIFETAKRPVERYVISTMDDRRREKMHLQTSLAAGLTLVGFICQFIGIRGITAWVSIAQLIITIIMSLLRGMVRMQRRGKEDNELKHYGHDARGCELDWLAFNLACGDCAKHRYSDDGDPKPQLHAGYSFQVSGRVVTASDVPSESPQGHGAQMATGDSDNTTTKNEEEATSNISVHGGKLEGTGSSKTHGPLDPKAVFDMRVKLANLTGNRPLYQPDGDECQSWDSELVDCREKASQIGKAVCDVASVLFANASERKSMQLHVGIGRLEPAGNSHQVATVELREPSGSTSTGWTIDTAAIEALLGLWLWSNSEKERNSEDGGGRFVERARIVSTGDGEVHWGRRTYIEGDLRLLLGQNAPTLRKAYVQVSPEEEYGLVNLWPKDILPDGPLFSPLGVPKFSSMGKIFFGWQRADSHLRAPGMKNRQYPILYVDTGASFVDICSQEIYTALISSMVSSPVCKGLDVTLQGKEAERRLVNDDFTAIRASFVEQELGTTTDAVLCLLSAFREKLHIRPTEENVVEIVKECLDLRDWTQPEPFLRWASLAFEGTNAKRIFRGIAEFYRRAMCNHLELGIGGMSWIISKETDSLREDNDMATIWEAILQRLRERGPARLPTTNRIKVALEMDDAVEGAVSALYMLCGNTVLTDPEGEEEEAEYDGETEDAIFADTLVLALKKAKDRPWSVYSSIALGLTQLAVFMDLTGNLDVGHVHGKESALAYAVDLDDFDLVHLLLENGADSGFTTLPQTRDTPLLHAARRKSTAMIALLVPFGTETEKEIIAYKKLLFRCACDGEYRHLATATAALERHHVKIDEKNEEGQTPLSLAARNGWPAVAMGLLAMNYRVAKVVDVDTVDNTQTTPLIWAARNTYRETSHRSTGDAEKDAQYKKERESRDRRHLQTLNTLLNSGRLSPKSLAMTDNKQMSVLHWAAQGGNEKVVKLLCHPGRFHDINSPDYRFRTPLAIAAGLGRVEAVELFLRHKSCQPNLADYQKQTPLHVAVVGGHADVVKLLVRQRGIDLNARDVELRTPLYLAVELGRTEMAILLADIRGVVMDRTNIFDRTPLSLAAGKGDVEFVRYTLGKYGGDRKFGLLLNHSDKSRFTALSFAIAEGRHEIIRLLLEHEMIEVPSPMSYNNDEYYLWELASQGTLDLLVELGIWRHIEGVEDEKEWELVEGWRVQG
ncbi:hypothetical protein OQA88_1105 [Cercophora sp. LCS_1]